MKISVPNPSHSMCLIISSFFPLIKHVWAACFHRHLIVIIVVMFISHTVDTQRPRGSLSSVQRLKSTTVSISHYTSCHGGSFLAHITVQNILHSWKLNDFQISFLNSKICQASHSLACHWFNDKAWALALFIWIATICGSMPCVWHGAFLIPTTSEPQPNGS